MKLAIVPVVLIGLVACVAKADKKPDPKDPKPAQPVQSEASKPMTQSEFLDLVNRVAAQRPYTGKAVEEATGVALTVSSSNMYFDIYTAKAPKPPFKGIEVRQSTSPKPKTGQVMFDLSSDLCLTEKDAVAKLGAYLDEGPSIPNPHGTGDDPAYRTWKYDWGTIKLGFARDTAACLKTVVLSSGG